MTRPARRERVPTGTPDPQLPSLVSPCLQLELNARLLGHKLGALGDDSSEGWPPPELRPLVAKLDAQADVGGDGSRVLAQEEDWLLVVKGTTP